jgi:hypothetical protein
MTEDDVPSWGPAGALAGLIALMTVNLIFSLLLAPWIHAESGSRLAQLTLFVLTQLAALSIALLMARASSSVWRGLGVRVVPAGSLIGAVFVAAALIGVVYLYGLTLAWLAPDWHLRLIAEQERQRALFDYPLPVLVLLAVGLAPLCEESFFRGLLFRGLLRSWGFWPAALVSGLVFAGAHLMPLNAPALTAIGVASAVLYAWQRSLVPSIVMHAAFNALSLLFGR